MKNQREEKQSQPFQRRPVSNLTNRLSASSCYNGFRVYIYIYTGCGNKSRAMKSRKRKKKKDKFSGQNHRWMMNCSYAPSHPPPKKGMSTKRTENKSRHDSRQTFTQWNHRGPTLSHGTDLTHVRLYQPRGSDWFWILAIARKRNLILSTVPFERREKG